MKRFLFLSALLLLTALPPIPLAAQGTSANLEQEDAARAALAEVDVDRLLTDRGYAESILGQIERLASSTEDPEAQHGLDLMRISALMILERPPEMRAALDRVLVQRSLSPDAYGAIWWGALTISDYQRAVTAVDQASRNLRGLQWAELRQNLSREQPLAVLQALDEASDAATRVRLAEALFRIGWPGDGDVESADFVRKVLIDARLDERDRDNAISLAAGLRTPSALLPLLILRRYDALFGADADRLTMLRASIARFDQESGQEMARAEPTFIARFARARYLRGVGRYREALDALQPLLQDVAATVAADEYGMWAVNEAVYLLLALERNDEAVALMERLVAVPLATNPSLVGPYINHSIVLREAGRPDEALAHARRVEAEHSDESNEYGRMVIASSIVCALADLGRSSEADPILTRMRAAALRTRGTLQQAYLCLNDLPAAEAVLIERLQDDDPGPVLVSLQNYQIEPLRASGADPDYVRLLSLRDRPAVRAAIDRVGRILDLPLASAE